jgi:nucleoid-associated protein YgaU
VPSDAEVDDYWTRLIAANRDRLAHGDDPDLVFPGQVFDLPPPPAADQR